jgi:hypothetical protein
MVTLNLSKKEISTIVECLLFSTGCDVCSSWDKNDIEAIFKIATSLKNQSESIDLNNVFIHNPLLENENYFLDEMTPKIISEFPEILKENIL